MNTHVLLNYSALLLLLSFGLCGCDGQDRFEDCYFNGEPVPNYEITAYNAITGEKVCWTEYRSPEYFGDKAWSYEGACEYGFEDGEHSFVSNITVTAPGFEAQTLENSPKPTDYLCVLEGEQTVVDFYLAPSAI
ncbi:hypothetical protein [Marinagarivorans cellulosilyticus]|uniref:Uncharacterized protein n=1 Tax=Marinagarivorans cellulosilyticus TaxID=2721545 RepID=A0AAN1WH62_9GAMM|nr:hypothetical protein [Marinagarivorans cellulosilyticus]BCD97525.1 hypothetical protein MARGE09_P1726 [Marinagarivorans cellulosilyticus]